MNERRMDHSVVALPSGDVFVTGGCCDEVGANHKTAEIYNVASGVWTMVPEMGTKRASHGGVRLADDRVLVFGGTSWEGGQFTPEVTLKSAEFFDLQLNQWTPAGTLPRPVLWPSAATLPDGRVVVFGMTPDQRRDYPDYRGLVFDPSTLTWTTTTPLPHWDDRCAVTALAEAKLLVTCSASSAAYFYDAHRDRFTSAGQRSTRQSYDSYVVDGTGAVVSAEGGARFDPALGRFEATGEVTESRTGARAVTLTRGGVLVVGGYSPASEKLTYRSTAELFRPEAGDWVIAGTMTEEQWRYRHAVVAIPDDRAIVIGGWRGEYGWTDRVEIYDPKVAGWGCSANE